MTKLSVWVRKHLVFRSGREKQSPNQLLLVSSSRRPITPESLDPPPAACLFFQLPYDIRIEIISMALGRRTLHVDVVQQDGKWQWRGGVCIRNRSMVLPSMRYSWLGPCFDSCAEDWEMERRKLTGNIPNAHDVGAMGFLLSCRQAYFEGIDVLYSTNCISIKTEQLLLQLPKLILHNRLASITSLEVIVEAHRVEKEFRIHHLEPVLANIATHCRHLRRLCLSFVVWQRHGHDILDGPALILVDAFWRSTRLRNMRVELPTRDYSAVKTFEPVINHPLEVPIKGLYKRSCWRSLDSEEPEMQWRSIERYPYPPLRLPVLIDGDEGRESSGYWLCEGHEGLHQGYCNCGEPY